MASTQDGVPHGQQSFGVTSWQHMVRKLYYEIDTYIETSEHERDKASRSYRALNICWTAWHIHDWFFEGQMDVGDEFLSVLAKSFPSVDFTQKRKRDRLAAFANALAERYWALRICRAVATAGKHGKAESHPEPNLTADQTTVIRFGEETSDVLYDTGFFLNGQLISGRQVFMQAANDWADFFKPIGHTLRRFP